MLNIWLVSLFVIFCYSGQVVCNSERYANTVLGDLLFGLNCLAYVGTFVLVIYMLKGI